jgi:hypothetical protein
MSREYALLADFLHDWSYDAGVRPQSATPSLAL